MKWTGLSSCLPLCRRAAAFMAIGAMSISPIAAFAAEKPQGSGQVQLFSSAAGTLPPPPWRVVGLPKSSKPLTRFDMVALDGAPVLRVQTDHSYANLVHDLPGMALATGTKLKWRWRLDHALQGTDLRQKAGDDSPLKVCALFDMPLEQLGFVERNLLRAARSMSGENLPAATLCYVWDARLPAGSLLDNAYSHRLRMIVLDSGEQHLGEWSRHAQDLEADFHRAFGQESSTLPPLIAVLVGADSDNTGGQSLGYVGDITLSP
jgi:hypothetical protein